MNISSKNYRGQGFFYDSAYLVINKNTPFQAQ